MTKAKNLSDFARGLPLDFVTPQMFGAVGDGVADDTAAIQAAQNTGRAVNFPSGNYLCGPITFTTAPRWIGAGFQETIINFPNFDGTWLSPASNESAYGTYIEGIKILGPGRNVAGNAVGFKGRETGSNTKITFKRCWFEDWPYAGVFLTDSYGNDFDDCRFRSCAPSASDGEGGGVWYENRVFSDTTASTGDLYSNCYFSGCRAGVGSKAGQRSDYQVFINSFFESNRRGIHMPLAQKAIMLGCYFEANSQHDALIQSGMDIQCRSANITYTSRSLSLDDLRTVIQRGGTKVFEADLGETVIRITEALLASGALKFGGATRGVYFGNGSPEGVVTCNVGSIFSQFDGYREPLWVKRSGTGNTGYRRVAMVEAGNTANRPGALTAGHSGFEYFDTSLGHPIWWTGTAWVDATGDGA